MVRSRTKKSKQSQFDPDNTVQEDNDDEEYGEKEKIVSSSKRWNWKVWVIVVGTTGTVIGLSLLFLNSIPNNHFISTNNGDAIEFAFAVQQSKYNILRNNSAVDEKDPAASRPIQPTEKKQDITPMTFQAENKPNQDQQQQSQHPIKPSKAETSVDETLHNLDYYFELSRENGHDKERILKLLLENAGIQQISLKTYHDLPNWSDVSAMYGHHGRLIGQKKHCEAFLGDGKDVKTKWLAPAGHFNTGTNLLSDALNKNCDLKHTRWQVPWGKHNPPKNKEFRNKNRIPAYAYMDPNQTLPVVIIRDPFRWLQSMCHNSYTSTWPRFARPDDTQYHCPNLWPTNFEKRELERLGYETFIDGTPMEKEKPGKLLHKHLFDDKVTRKATRRGHPELGTEAPDMEREPVSTTALTPDELKIHHFPVRVHYWGKQSINVTRFYYSLVHLWNEWYTEYNQLEASELPHLMTRMEDLLFFPDEVVPAMCHCAGGQMKHRNTTTNEPLPVQIPVSSTKAKGHNSRLTPRGQQDHQTGYIDALIKYGSPDTRLRGHTPQDLQYAAQYLDKDLMELFGYKYPLAGDSPMIATSYLE